MADTVDTAAVRRPVLLLNAVQGGATAGLGVTLLGTLAVAALQQFTLASLHRSNPTWFADPHDGSAGAFARALAGAAVGWLAAAAVMDAPPNLFDGRATPLRLR